MSNPIKKFPSVDTEEVMLEIASYKQSAMQALAEIKRRLKHVKGKNLTVSKLDHTGMKSAGINEMINDLTTAVNDLKQ